MNVVVDNNMSYYQYQLSLPFHANMSLCKLPNFVTKFHFLGSC